MIAVDRNATATREDREFECDRCGGAFLRTVGINPLGELVGGDINRPRRCDACRGKVSRLSPGDTVRATCKRCGGDFSYIRPESLQGRIRSVCPDCNVRANYVRKPPRKCKRCGNDTPSALKAFCTEECRQAQKQDKRSASGKKPCSVCGRLCLGIVCRPCFRNQQHGIAVENANRRATAVLSPAAITGRTGEAYFDLIAATQAWRTLQPTGDCMPGVDRVVVLCDVPLTVQIKTASVLKEPCFQFHSGKPPNADMLCVVDLHSLNMWIVEIARGQMFVRFDDAQPWNFCSGAVGSVRGIAKDRKGDA
jgi:hypothetical protein